MRRIDWLRNNYPEDIGNQYEYGFKLCPDLYEGMENQDVSHSRCGTTDGCKMCWEMEMKEQ